MDTSKEYIEMCEKAVEIQLLWAVEEGDFCTDRDFQCRTPVGCIDDGQAVGEGEEQDIEDWQHECIWLPRQDQLQDMIQGSQLEVIAGFTDWVFGLPEYQTVTPTPCPSEQFTSMEQLWLAFVMSEKFGKFWNGEDWEKHES